MHARPQAPTPSTAPRAIDSDELWSPTRHNNLDAFPPSGQPVFASPSRMPEDADESHPDGSLHPPYASYRPPHPTYTPASLTPALSSAGSSSASTRSSAYTSSGSALAHSDYGNHVHVATPSDNEDDQPGSPLAIGVGITSDQVNNPHASALVSNPNLNPNSNSHSRVPIDQARWSHSYSGSIRSRTSLVRPNGNGMHDAGANTSPPLNSKKSYDASWQPITERDERDEVDLTSGDETDETDLDQDDLDDDDDDQEEEAHQAVVLAEEGRGLIVHGEGVPTVQLQVQNGMSICSYAILCVFLLLLPTNALIQSIIRLSSHGAPLHLPQYVTSISISVFAISFMYHDHSHQARPTSSSPPRARPTPSHPS